MPDTTNTFVLMHSAAAYRFRSLSWEYTARIYPSVGCMNSSRLRFCSRRTVFEIRGIPQFPRGTETEIKDRGHPADCVHGLGSYIRLGQI